MEKGSRLPIWCLLINLGFCQASQDQMTFLFLLLWLEVISNLRMNLDKSELILVDKVENIQDLAFELRCNVGSFCSTYLGLLLDAPFR